MPEPGDYYDPATRLRTAVDKILVVFGPLADSIPDVLVESNVPSLKSVGPMLEKVGVYATVGVIFVKTVDTISSNGAGQYAERYDQQLNVTYVALASAAVGSITGQLVATHVLAGLGVIVTGPALAVAVVSGTVIVSGLTFSAGLISKGLYEKYVSTGVKSWSKDHYNRNVGYFR